MRLLVGACEFCKGTEWQALPYERQLAQLADCAKKPVEVSLLIFLRFTPMLQEQAVVCDHALVKPFWGMAAIL
jgi:hypothetical protein